MAHIKQDVRILVVDDFATMRRIVRDILGSLGYTNVVEAEDGRQALDAVSNEPVDIVISDWNMPRMMGLDLLRELRARPQTENLPFLMVAPESHRANVLEAIQAGASNYVVKPFTAEILEQKLKTILSQLPPKQIEL